MKDKLRTQLDENKGQCYALTRLIFPTKYAPVPDYRANLKKNNKNLSNSQIKKSEKKN